MVDRLIDYGDCKAVAERLQKLSQKYPDITLSEGINQITQELANERILADL